MKELADRTMAAIFAAMPVGEWVSARDVHFRLQVGARGTVKKGLIELARMEAVDVKLESLSGHFAQSLYRRPAA